MTDLSHMLRLNYSFLVVKLDLPFYQPAGASEQVVFISPYQAASRSWDINPTLKDT